MAAVNLSTAKMSSKGQIVIPEAVRNQLGLKAGAQFVVIGHGDSVLLKVITPPSTDEIEAALKRLRLGARAAGRTRKDVPEVINAVRSRK
jgi:AbrB family looped-hinge helix DNA binding protein